MFLNLDRDDTRFIHTNFTINETSVIAFDAKQAFEAIGLLLHYSVHYKILTLLIFHWAHLFHVAAKNNSQIVFLKCTRQIAGNKIQVFIGIADNIDRSFYSADIFNDALFVSNGCNGFAMSNFGKLWLFHTSGVRNPNAR